MASQRVLAILIVTLIGSNLYFSIALYHSYQGQLNPGQLQGGVPLSLTPLSQGTGGNSSQGELNYSGKPYEFDIKALTNISLKSPGEYQFYLAVTPPVLNAVVLIVLENSQSFVVSVDQPSSVQALEDRHYTAYVYISGNSSQPMDTMNLLAHINITYYYVGPITNSTSVENEASVLSSSSPSLYTHNKGNETGKQENDSDTQATESSEMEVNTNTTNTNSTITNSSEDNSGGSAPQGHNDNRGGGDHRTNSDSSSYSNTTTISDNTTETTQESNSSYTSSQPNSSVTSSSDQSDSYSVTSYTSSRTNSRHDPHGSSKESETSNVSSSSKSDHNSSSDTESDSSPNYVQYRDLLSYTAIIVLLYEIFRGYMPRLHFSQK